MNIEADLEALKAAIVGRKPVPDMAQVLRAALGGSLAVLERYQLAVVAANRELWPKLVVEWRRGSLFGSQGLDFLSYLMQTEEEVEADQRAWGEVRGCIEALDLKAGSPEARKLVEELEAFSRSRVAAFYQERRAWLNGKGTGLKVMTEQQQKAYTAKREAYMAEAKRWGWRS